MLLKNQSLPLRWFIFIGISTLLTSCGLFKKGQEDKMPASRGVENFDRFYNRFHEDPDFQLARIDFPIEGQMIDGSGEYEWTEDNWPIMKVRIQDIDEDLYKTEVRRQATSFYQKFWAEDSGFFAEYRFELKNGKWYLVYAKDVNL